MIDKQQNNRVTVPSLALVSGRDMTLVLLLLVAAVSTVHGQDKPTARLSMSINRDPPLTKGGNMTIVCSVATILTPWREMSSMDMTSQPEQPLLSAKKGQGKNYRRTFHNSARYNILQSDGVVCCFFIKPSSITKFISLSNREVDTHVIRLTGV